MTNYKVKAEQFKEMVNNSEDFLMVFEDGEVRYLPATASLSGDEDYSMVVDPSLYNDVEIDQDFMEQEVLDWSSTLEDRDIKIELA